MKTAKILFSMFLAVAMLLSFGAAALAEDGEALVVRPDGSETETVTLAEAIQAAGDNDTVRLSRPARVEGALLIGKSIRLDLNGNTLTLTTDTDLDAAILVTGKTVLIQNGTIKTVSGDDAAYAAAIKTDSDSCEDLTLDNITLMHAGDRMFTGGHITVYDGSYSSDPSDYLPAGYSAELKDGMYIVSETPEERETPEEPEAPEEPEIPEEPETPEEPKTEEPETPEEPKTEEPKTEEPKTEEPKTEEPKTEEPKTEEPKTEEPKTEEPKTEDKDEKEDLPAGIVKTSDDKDPAALNYYKSLSADKPRGGLGGDKSYIVSHTPTGILVGSTGKELKFTVKKDGSVITLTIPEKDNREVLEALPAGVHALEIQFDAASSAALTLNVYMDLSLDTDTHVKNSGKPIVVTVTDKPGSVLVSDKSDMSEKKTLTEGTDYTVSGDAVTLTAAFLDSLGNDDTAVTKYLGFWISYGSSGVANVKTIKILPPPTITTENPNWKRSADKIFTVKPDLLSVSIDGKEVSKDDYSISGNTLTFPRGKAIAELSYGEHTLTAETSSGPASITIIVKPSLGYSTTTGCEYTKGTSKGLMFIASDPVVSVKVNGKEISKDNYKLSEDKKTITLNTGYLNNLDTGKEYTITAVVKAGDKEEEVSCAFKVLPGKYNGRTPQTGDPSADLWLALLLLSGTTAAALLPKLKKQ